MVSGRNRFVNILAQQVRVIGNAVVGLLIVRLVFLSLGSNIYANIAVVLSVIGYVGILGNSLTGAMARYLTKSVAEDNLNDASEYFSNAFLAVAIITLGAEIVIAGGALLRPGIWGAMPVSFLLVMLSVPALNCMAGILGTANFIRERFASSSSAFLFGRLLYLVLAWWLIKSMGLGYWSIALANIAAGLAICLVLGIMFRAFLPQVRFQFSMLSLGRLKELLLFVGWTLLVYSGIYLASSGVLVVARNATSGDTVLVKIALGFQVGSMINQMLASIGVATSPAIYRYLGQEKYRHATAMVENYIFLTTIMGGAILISLNLEWRHLLRLWLGVNCPTEMGGVLTGIGFSFTVASFGVPFSVFFAGLGRVRVYGIACLVEGLITITGAFVSLKLWPDRADFVCWLPGIVGMCKLAFVYRMSCSEFQPSSVANYLLKTGRVIGVSVFATLVWLGLVHVVPVGLWPIPIVGLLAPFIVYFLYSFKKVGS